MQLQSYIVFRIQYSVYCMWYIVYCGMAYCIVLSMVFCTHSSVICSALGRVKLEGCLKSLMASKRFCAFTFIMCRALIWCICCVFPYREHRDECQGRAAAAAAGDGAGDGAGAGIWERRQP